MHCEVQVKWLSYLGVTGEEKDEHRRSGNVIDAMAEEHTDGSGVATGTLIFITWSSCWFLSSCLLFFYIPPSSFLYCYLFMFSLPFIFSDMFTDVSPNIPPETNDVMGDGLSSRLEIRFQRKKLTMRAYIRTKEVIGGLGR